MTESTSVHHAARVVAFPTLEDEVARLLAEWEQVRQAFSTAERFEAAAYRELLGAAEAVDSDPDRLWHAIDAHAWVSDSSVLRHRATEEAIAGRARVALRHRLEQTYLRLDEEALADAEDAY
jgi:hypothetical protein